MNSELALKGTIRHLIGATTGGRDKTCYGSSMSSCILKPSFVAYTSSDIILSSPVAVFEQRVQDSADTKRGLDDVGGIFTDWGVSD